MNWYLAAGDLAAVPRLRAEVVAHLALQAVPGSDLEDARLVISELLANAVQHSGGPVRLALRWEGRHPKVTVSDVGPGFLTSGWGSPKDPTAEGGRGLFLVSMLARELEIAARSGGGSAVSATLEVDRAQSATQHSRGR